MHGNTRSYDTVAVITGASGGIGAACARGLGRHHALLLTALHAEKLEALADSLRQEGYAVTTVAGDITDPVLVRRLAEAADTLGTFRVLVHAAASANMSDWRRVMDVNYIASVRIADAFLPLARAGCAAVLLASTAGHREPRDARLDALLENPSAPDFLAQIEAFSGGEMTAGRAYFIAKYGVIRLCERSAVAWGRQGARIVSVTPGYINTPMTMGLSSGDKARLAEGIQHSALGRWGTPLDIAGAVDFLCSDQASYISGVDLRVDGGLQLDRSRSC